MCRKLMLFLLSFVSIQTFAQIPFINSFSPTNGPVGTVVTITGANFGNDANSNNVYFGGVKASIVSASNNQIVAVVPKGATYKAISITTNGLISFSARPFVVTYPNGQSMFDIGESFAPKVDLPIGSQGTTSPNGILSADFDGDGKPDLAVLESAYKYIYIYKNTGTANPFSSSPTLKLGFAGNIYMTIGDFDGDGRLDIATVNYLESGLISVYQNISENGNIIFTDAITFNGGKLPLCIATGDFDGDGKLDLATANVGEDTFSVLLNNSANGNISFATKQDFPTGKSPYSIAIEDMDGDGKPDIVVANHAAYTVSVIRNTTTSGTLSFAPKIDYLVGSSPMTVLVADLDGDEKPDIITTNHLDFGRVTEGTLFRNTSTSGNLSFAAKTNYYTGPYSSAAIADMDGDGKPDLVLIDKTDNRGALVANKSTPGTLKLTGMKSIYGLGSPTAIVIGDFNLDGKPDLAITNYTTNTVSVLINQVNPLRPTITSFNPIQAGEGTEVTITGTNFTDVTAVQFGDIPAASFTVESPTLIKAIVGKNASGFVSVTTANGTGNSEGFVFIKKPAVSKIAISPSGINYSVVITGLNLENASAISFSGIPATSFTVNSNNQITAITGSDIFNAITITTPGGTTIFNYIPPPIISSFSTSSGGTGSVVLITGTNFINVTSVTFGGTVAASFVVNSATSISAIVGTGSTGIVSVTTSYGKANSTDRFNFIAKPVISSFSPVSAKKSAKVTIIGANFTNATNVIFGDTPAASFIVNSATSITATLGNGSSGSVSVTTSAGTAKLDGFIFNSPPVITSFSPTTVIENTQIVINGTNFTGTTGVTIGGVAAKSFTINSPTNITAVVGKNANINTQVIISTPQGDATINGLVFISKPIITANGPLAFTTGNNVVLNTIQGSDYAYQWTKNNIAIPGANSSFYSASESGVYTVILTVGTQNIIADPVEVSVQFTLPTTNFSINCVGVTCKGSTNGSINIRAIANLNYEVSLSGNNTNKTTMFTSSTSFADLAAGTYNLCLTVPSENNYKQCYTLIINEPKDLTLYANMSNNNTNLNLSLSGGMVYNIQLNNVLHTTKDSVITLPLQKGKNSLLVTTDRPCQGVIEKILITSNDITPYPNPFDNVLYVEIGNRSVSKLTAEIFSTTGIEVYKKSFNNASGTLQLDLQSIKMIGIYTLRLTIDGTQETFKIIKK
jgi:hypothetical protein